MRQLIRWRVYKQAVMLYRNMACTSTTLNAAHTISHICGSTDGGPQQRVSRSKDRCEIERESSADSSTAAAVITRRLRLHFTQLELPAPRLLLSRLACSADSALATESSEAQSRATRLDPGVPHF